VIESVLGPLSPGRAGIVSTNEHVLTDSRGLLRPTREGGTLTGPIRPDILGELRWNWMSLADNLTLDDEQSAVGELSSASALGLTTIVEATSVGMGPRHRDLPDIARRSGVNIVAAYGSYIDKTLPSWWRDLDETAIERVFTAALVDRIPGTDFRAGLLGLLGTSAEITPAERHALDAAGRSATAAGASVSIRLDAAARRGPEVAGLLMAQGLPADRILFCNIDKVLDLEYVTEVVDTGAVVEFAFGSEHQFGDGARDATDEQRIEFLFELLGERPLAAITLSCSVWTKGQLSRHGGMGYGHVVGRIAPSLRRRGLAESTLHDMLVTRPARVLDRG
jgi:phosphotriesterase-related protein